MAWKAIHRYCRTAPRKARLIIDLIRGRDVQDALNILKFTPNKMAVLVSKVLNSAIANASQDENVDVNALFVSEARVDDGVVMKRFEPKDRGRAYTIRKRTSHIVVAVDQGQE